VNERIEGICNPNFFAILIHGTVGRKGREEEEEEKEKASTLEWFVNVKE
jgi:hypothetical protein